MSFLATLWFFLILVVLELFIVLDGADLGIGILSLTNKPGDRSKMLDNIGPAWYANETWLVIAAGALFAVFPHAYSIILSSMYLPVLMIVFGLMFRAASTEFRGWGKKGQYWDMALGGGSLMAVLGLGLLLGGLLGGLEIQDGSYTGPFWQWLNLTSVVTALGIMASFALLGAARLIADRQTGPPRVIRALSWADLFLFLLTLILVWLRLPREVLASLGLLKIGVVSLLTALTVVALVILSLQRQQPGIDRTPHWLGIIAMVAAGGSLVWLVFPYVVPFSLTIEEAASSQTSMVFALFGVGIVIPIVIAYNIYIRKVMSREY